VYTAKTKNTTHRWSDHRHWR